MTATTFSPATFESTVAVLRTGYETLARHLAELPHTIERAVSRPWVPGWFGAAVRHATDGLRALCRDVLSTVGEMLEGAAAPVLFAVRALDWSREVGGPASGVAGTVHPNALRATLTWQGEAASAYRAAVAGQSAAAGQVHTIASAVSTSLVTCATAGLAFYIAMGLIVAKVVAAVVVVVAALGSIAFSWAGVLYAIEEAGVTLAMALSALTAFTAAQMAATGALLNLTNAAENLTVYPSGHWPRGVA